MAMIIDILFCTKDSYEITDPRLIKKAIFAKNIL